MATRRTEERDEFMDNWTEEEKDALRQCFGQPEPLDPARIEATVAKAREFIGRRRRWRRLAIQAASLTIAVGLVAGAFWIRDFRELQELAERVSVWDGEDPSVLTFSDKVRVATTPDYHEPSKVQTACGHLWIQARDVIDDLEQSGQLGDRARDALLYAINEPYRSGTGASGNFEELAARLNAGETLPQFDRTQLLSWIRTGIYALRDASKQNENLRIVNNIARKRFLEQLGVDDPSRSKEW